MLSVLNQRAVDLEYIVVDSGSTDGSRELVEKYRDRLAHVVFEPDQGPADGLNKGFALATGDLFGYLNSDDVFMPDALVKAQHVFKSRPGIDVVSAHGYLVDARDRMLHRVFSHRFDLRRYGAMCCVVVQPSTFFRSNIFRRVGGFNVVDRTNWDGELAADLALHNAKFKVVHDYWSCFRVHPGSITGSRNSAQRRTTAREIIARKLGYSEVSALRCAYLRYTGWLMQPTTLTLRIFDGIVHPERFL
jgi:glycosyltransferase involved in cell wall biosynthesis